MAVSSYALVALLLLAGSLLAACSESPHVLEELITGGDGLAGAAKNKITETITGHHEGGGHEKGYGEKKEEHIEDKGAGHYGPWLGFKEPKELFKLLLNPIEFIKHIAKTYKLHFAKFFEILKKGFSFGLELALQPALLTLKIVEKIFVPDACKLKFICKLAHPLSFSKELLPHLSSKFLEGSHIIKAVSDGLHGIDCEATYSHCAHGGLPTLKKEYEEAAHHNGHEHGGHHHEGGHEHGYEAHASNNLFKTLTG